jgi:hypothetical protein
MANCANFADRFALTENAQKQKPFERFRFTQFFKAFKTLDPERSLLWQRDKMMLEILENAKQSHALQILKDDLENANRKNNRKSY